MAVVSVEASRYHDISCGHRVCGHEGSCKNLHGHNYRIWFTVRVEHGEGLDDIGRVIDFSEVKTRLGYWLDQCWDHRFLIWRNDPTSLSLLEIDSSTVLVSFNPTAENMALFLLEEVGPEVLKGTNAKLVKVKVQETAKCSAEAML